MNDTKKTKHIVIACGGTGGHLFPGIAVGRQLLRRQCEVTLIISEKEVDSQAVRDVDDMTVVTLPAVGLSGKNYLAFTSKFLKSFMAARKLFKAKPPQAVLAMGGFTAVPPVIAGKLSRVPTFLHESNAVPGRANRMLANLVNRVFVGFDQAASQFPRAEVSAFGTPIRPQFSLRDPAIARTTLGLDPDRLTLLVMGGSQGSGPVNELFVQGLPQLVKLLPDFQFIHLTGAKDGQKVRQAYAAAGVKSTVKPFLAEMDVALSAATVAVSRSGASSLAEIAAFRVPTVLIPYPEAIDNHQLVNAREYEKTGAARLLEQANATPEALGQLIQTLAKNQTVRQSLLIALACWYRPRAAEAIADQVLTESRAKS
jgi:UDP-N-acetylglucosamine--N-acetylmuramyl-(pentapeptide) pyrophosphoryl-undecaprenol N-acetylglucosamine transferase